MKKEVADKWVAALRSGEYEQGKQRLKSDGKYCCLGVLCDISKMATWGPEDTVALGMGYDGRLGSLPPSVMEWAGMKSSTGLSSKHSSLSSLNDDAGAPFSEIADIIEKQWEEL